MAFKMTPGSREIDSPGMYRQDSPVMALGFDGGKKKISKETRKKVQAAKKAGRKEGDKRWQKEAGEHMDKHGTMSAAATAPEIAKAERWMARQNRKYAKSQGASKELRKNMKKATRKSGAGSVRDVQKRHSAESKRVWDNQRAAKKAAKKNPSKKNLSKLKEAQAQRRQNSQRRSERFRRRGSDS